MIWLPVESDSEIITQYAHKLGLKDSFQFIDLFTFDASSAVEFGIPIDQCKGMILLFPLSPDNKEEDRKAVDESNPKGSNPIEPKFIKQTIENSCCLMALLHLLLNNPLELLNQSEATPEIIKNLQLKMEDDEKLIEKSPELKEIHDEMAKTGGTEVPDIEDNVPFHFVALIPFKETVWLMDGRRAGPIEFQSTGSFFETACKIANEEFVKKSADQTNFAAVILV